MSKRNESGTMGSWQHYLIHLLIIGATWLDRTHSFAAVHRSGKGLSQTFLRAHSLNTAFEWLSEERRKHDPGYNYISWIDPSVFTPSDSSQNNRDSEDSNGGPDVIASIPLYPLGATYLPSGTNQTLVNVEPRNVKMAQDLISSPSPLFCAVLRASDTGRIANIGTLLRILDAEEQTYEDGSVARIRLTCRAEELVEICEVLNPEAFSAENRLRRSPEYLRARVQKLSTAIKGAADKESEMIENETEKMKINFNMIKTIYQLNIGSEGFPPSTLYRLGNGMAAWNWSSLGSEELFWQAAQEWQSVCHTIQQGKQAMLSTNRNELMVEAAIAAGGALKLPIHLEDLSPQDRRRVQAMEVAAQNEYLEMAMDPCLDFQALVSIPNHENRILWLSKMISRERTRLEDVATTASKQSRSY